jgi:hypothetical protein
LYTGVEASHTNILLSTDSMLLENANKLTRKSFARESRLPSEPTQSFETRTSS